MKIPRIMNYAKNITELKPEMIMRRHPNAVVSKMTNSGNIEELRSVKIEVETKLGSLLRYEFDNDKRLVSKTVDKIISAEKSRFKTGYHFHLHTENCDKYKKRGISTNTSIYAQGKQDIYVKKIYQLKAKIEDFASRMLNPEGKLDFLYREVNYRSNDTIYNRLSNQFYNSNNKIKVIKTPKGLLKFQINEDGNVTAQYKQGKKLVFEFKNDIFDEAFQNNAFREVQKLEPTI